MGSDFEKPMTREQYEAWITASRARGRRERITRRVVVAGGIIGAILALFLLMVIVGRAEAVPVRMSVAVETKPDPKESGDLAVAKERCEQAGGEWMEDEESAPIPGAKVVGCFWIVPKDMK